MIDAHLVLDSMLQSFQGLMFRLQAVHALLPDRIPEAMAMLEKALDHGDRALAEGRTAVHDLRSNSIRPDALETFVSLDAPIRILTADDHPLLREGIASLIGTQRDMRLVAEAATGRETIEQFRAVRPDVTLLDIQMPDTSGIDALITIRSEFPTAKVIILTTYGGDALAERALKAGASSYVLKGLVRKDLLETIRAVHAGQRRIHPQVASELAAHLGAGALSDREIEVLTLVAGGNSNKAIGARLSITEETVKAHLKRIIAKLGANDRTHAVTLAMSRGILLTPSAR